MTRPVGERRAHFVRPLRPEPAWSRAVRCVVGTVIAAQVVLAMISGYRALVQVYRLDIARPAQPLRPGSHVEATVVTSGRATVTVRFELRQGAHAQVLGVREVPANGDPALDPRPRRAVLGVTLTPAMLQSLAAGRAVLRAVAVGRAQWLRVPPPTVAAAAVAVEPR